MPKTVAKKRLGTLATYNSANIMGGKIRVDPKSGCRKINNIGAANVSPTLAMTFHDSFRVVISDLARIEAPRIKVPILAPSVGCNLNTFKSIQRLEPEISTPKNWTMINKIIPAMNMKWAFSRSNL